MKPRTLFDKVWDAHVVHQDPGAPAILYIDLHLIHEVTSPQAFALLRERGLRVRRPDRTVATMDHSTPTIALDLSLVDEKARRQVLALAENARAAGIRLYDLQHPQRGIVHVLGPELGLTQPGMTIVCGDSHTATHGAFGALAFGIGTTQVAHVLATQALLMRRPKTMRVTFTGQRQPGVTAKDMILGLIARIGTDGGRGHVIEYAGEAVRALDMAGRMTLSNMSIEAGARAGMIAPDDTTFEYLSGREFAPKGEAWERALAYWRTLPTDEGATFDKEVTFDVSDLEPMITYGTTPGMAIPIRGRIPDPAHEPDLTKRRLMEKALAYMGFRPGQPIEGQRVDWVFIGSCTNGRLEDLRQAARILRGRRVAEGVRMIVVPGSETVRRQAEAEGLDRIFKAAGAEWRHAGCSLCIAMNGDRVPPGAYAVSTSNRNFEGRQGPGARTLLASPLTAAASAVEGRVADPRRYLETELSV
ncbi:MAG: 3-isopropylmalate dehydratase large subunit [Chloroflexi bacterium]|nr:3-isopropylmalate dehydratase large subunit [Chloroflexota bacterium]